MSRRDLAASLLHRSGAVALRRRLPQAADRVIVLAYHRVVPYDDHYPFDEELISASPDQFDWQIRYLKQHYHLTTFEALGERLNSGLAPHPRSVIVTFDDGFDDNYLQAFPILKKHQACASFFVATDYIGSEEVFWFDRVVFLSRNLAAPITLESAATQSELLLRPIGRSREQENRLLRFCKVVPDHERHAAIVRLNEAVGDIEIPSHLSRAMDWDQLAEMSGTEWAEIGSHSCSHPVLSRLEDSQLQAEISGSRATLTERLDCACVAITYPNGGAKDIDDRVLQAVQAAGYQFAATYMSGANIISAEHDFLLRRLHVERYTTRSRFAAMLEYPKLLG